MAVSTAFQPEPRYMEQALDCARRGSYTTMPNPRVGCVLVRDDVVVGRGWHRYAGGAHAEVDALVEAGSAARGATAYVTLEPCSLHGRTPPCCDELIRAGVGCVVVSMRDPGDNQAGRGINRLRAAGIVVSEGLLESESRALNEGFIKRTQHGLPLLICKLAMSLDGRTAMASGQSRWITGEAARAEVQQLRASACAVLSGVGTVLADDPALRLRAELWEAPEGHPPEFPEREPLRVVLDSRLRTPPTARLFSAGGEVLVITAAALDSELAEPLRQCGATLQRCAGDDGQVELLTALRWLATERECNTLLLEAGPTLAAALLSAGLVDRLLLYVAPTLLGSMARPLFELPLERLADGVPLHIEAVRAVGRDWCVEARPAPLAR